MTQIGEDAVPLEMTQDALAAPLVGRDRRAHCRRRPLHQTSWRWIFGGRRRRCRRAGDAHLDWYPPSLFAVTLGILLASAVDAWLTLLLLREGLVYEANPLMGHLLHIDVQLFVNLKTAVTGAGLLFLVAFSRTQLFGRVAISHCLYALLTGYVALIAYEVTCAFLGGAFTFS